MFRRKKTVVFAGVLLTGLAIVLSQKSKSFQDWTKRKIEDVYFRSLDEKDIASG